MFGQQPGDLTVMIHCGSRGLGLQIGSAFLQQMVAEASRHGLTLVAREMACASIRSAIGQECLGAIRADINCAPANRQRLTHLVPEVFARHVPRARVQLLYDVSHDAGTPGTHRVEGRLREL